MTYLHVTEEFSYFSLKASAQLHKDSKNELFEGKCLTLTCELLEEVSDPGVAGSRG